MKFVVTSTDLLQQLQAVAKVISSKSIAAVPVLENILFELQGNQLTLTAADQSNRQTCFVEVNNSQGEDGAFAVRSQIIIDSLKELPDQPIEVEVDIEAGKASVTYSNGHFSFLTTSAEIYPEGVSLEDNQTKVVELPAQSLLRALERTVFAASDDERRPVMTGVLLDFFPEQLITVATDGRILVRYTDHNIKSAEAARIVLPSRMAYLLTRGILAKETGTVKISFDGRNAHFQMTRGALTVRLLEGTYPNYNSVIPPSSVHNILLENDQLFFAAKLVSLFANKASSLIVFHFADGALRITAQDLDLSIAAEETIPCSGQEAGTQVRIGFDFNFLQRLLQSFTSEQVQFGLTDQTRAGVITPLAMDEGIEICTLIIPMKLLGE